MRNKLTYSEGREVEKLIRKSWAHNGYQPGHSDDTIATLAEGQLKQPVTAVNVRYIREQIGYVLRTERATACVGSLLSVTELRRVEELLREHRRVVVTHRTSRTGNRVAIMSLETYLNHKARMAKVKPWLANGAGGKRAQVTEAVGH